MTTEYHLEVTFYPEDVSNMFFQMFTYYLTWHRKPDDHYVGVHDRENLKMMFIHTTATEIYFYLNKTEFNKTEKFKILLRSRKTLGSNLGTKLIMVFLSSSTNVPE
jgi:hypothetical protein